MLKVAVIVTFFGVIPILILQAVFPYTLVQLRCNVIVVLLFVKPAALLPDAGHLAAVVMAHLGEMYRLQSPVVEPRTCHRRICQWLPLPLHMPPERML